MAEYKVAQDVEAEDKLIGPFSFRQFIYLIIAAVAVALAWGLGQIFIGLAIIPLPVIIFFTVLALPLRKDQPMEIYVAAIISYRLKPRKRVWSPDGIESLIEITVPKAVDEHLTKDLSQMETEKRLSPRVGRSAILPNQPRTVRWCQTNITQLSRQLVCSTKTAVSPESSTL